VLAAAAVAAALGAGPAPAARAQAPAPPTAHFTCTPAPADCSGWRTGDVQLKWFPDADASEGCDFRTYSAEGVWEQTCRVQRNGEWRFVTATVRIDRTPPAGIGARAARAPDGPAGWFTRPVDVGFTGTDATSGIASCTTLGYGGPDSASATLEGTCRDHAGHVGEPVLFTLRYDATAPVVTALRPARPPDRAGWYTRPVIVTAGGSDATSGIADCPPVTYAGPDNPAAHVTAGCRDVAGNLATRTLPLRYDATPPRLGAVAAEPGDRLVRLRWIVPADARRVRVTRAPGRRGTRSSVLVRRAARGLTDTAVRNGRRYVYRVTALDAAGNATTRSVVLRPGRRLLAPAARARLAGPPLLRWTAVRGARYYNVQLFRGARKVLSAWPRLPRLRLHSTWRFAGTTRTLRAGRYRWYVWPGIGEPRLRRFGPLVGRRDFTLAGGAAGALRRRAAG
jgi:hypothetical protein